MLKQTSCLEFLSFFITVIEGRLLFIFIPPAALFGFPVVA
ncbi:hypothetical protein CLOLEP_03739 [[Clostridium] leptum DSM 753]|uniref:Uncharacterized protein n=1 Tax=[Clostridium] leptum DSM 753 TaxID=428125 RepID=A7VYR1_9FIRM|nr:hypothetical protein CLOLEP_03739 [[Clostridium] leptum DSM 753]